MLSGISEPSTTPADTNVQIKVWLLGISPLVWRRVWVPTSFTLRELHSGLQVAMGWQANTSAAKPYSGRRASPFDGARGRRKNHDVSITELADEIGVSRKFVCTQAHRVGAALDAAFATAANDDNPVLFELRVTQEVVEQMILGFCRNKKNLKAGSTTRSGRTPVSSLPIAY